MNVNFEELKKYRDEAIVGEYFVSKYPNEYFQVLHPLEKMEELLKERNIVIKDFVTREVVEQERQISSCRYPRPTRIVDMYEIKQ